MSPRIVLIAFAGVLSVFGVKSAFAHPHVWVDMKTQLLFDDAGRLSGLRHNWKFDEGYSAFAVTGLDGDGDGTLSRAELEPLAKVNMDSLHEFAYFTYLMSDGVAVPLSDPIDYTIEYKDGHASLIFTLPLKKPLDSRQKQTNFAVYDPTFYVDFVFAKEKPVSLADKAPAGCHADYVAPKQPDGKTVKLSEMTEEDFENLDPSNNMGADFNGRVRLTCDDAASPPQSPTK